ncbi:MAG: glutamate-1-semialdehyde 2,1-aminomutase [Deltaproteobacteria bacterium]|nr:glutamate-1-semialdehyde 2,1-aminomutase [Deltaproteobacteria bacterium]
MRVRSEQLFASASEVLVGGVNSPVRAFKGVALDDASVIGGRRAPLFIDRAEGPWLYDVDGNGYIDYVLSWGPMLLGHADPRVVRAVSDQARKGTSFGAPCGLEEELARLVIKTFPHVEKLRFVSSGTEATMSALRLARGVTGRDGLIKCEGCYHGHADSFLVKAGSGVATLGLPDSPGVPADLAKHTFTIPFNDLAALEQTLNDNKGKIAVVCLEPVVGNMGCVPPVDGYLQGVRDLCTKHGTLLMFDEVMTGFRVALGGAAQHYGVTPDITTFGKVIGGGLPVGAFASTKAIMKNLAPEGPIYQAGTLSGNPLAMAAGIATLKQLIEERAPDYASLAARTKRLAEGIAAGARAAGFPACSTSVGSMFSVFLRKDVPRNWPEVKDSDAASFKRFFWAMQERGVYLAPSAFESGFTSFLHSDALIDQTIKAATESFATLKA